MVGGMTVAGPSATESADARPGLVPTTAVGPVGPFPAGPFPVRLGPAAASRCRRRVHLDADPTALRSLRSVADDGLRLRLADGALHHHEVLAALRTYFPADPELGLGPAKLEQAARSFSIRRCAAKRDSAIRMSCCGPGTATGR